VVEKNCNAPTFYTNFSLFICLGPVELAAAGVSIALFNQASRITIFPLVSITTSFVAEENTIEKINKEKNLTENIKAKSKEVRPEDHLIQDIEKGASKEHNETPTEYSSSRSGTSELVPKDSAPENVESDGTFWPFLVLPFTNTHDTFYSFECIDTN